MGRVDDQEREEYQNQRRVEEALDRPYVEAQELKGLIAQIRTEYVVMCKTRKVVMSVTEVAQGEGFYVQRLIKRYGFKVVVIALKPVSARAKQLYERYGGKWKK